MKAKSKRLVKVRERLEAVAAGRAFAVDAHELLTSDRGVVSMSALSQCELFEKEPEGRGAPAPLSDPFREDLWEDYD